jgi:hypothetical protein
MKKLKAGQFVLIFLFTACSLILGIYVITKPTKKVEVVGYSPFREVTAPPGKGTPIESLASPLRTREYTNPPTHYTTTVTD